MSQILFNIKNEIKKAVIGHDELIDSLIVALLCDGHILLEGVPGLAKTTTVNALAKTLALNFKRVQFTPDLLPLDIIGTQIYDMKSGEFKIKKGPIFTNILLADEINRAPAKVQSALLEAMQEKQSTIGDDTFEIEKPFLVLATQNPIEQEGAYALPEAQLDRFMQKIVVGYNTQEEERMIAKKVANNLFEPINAVATKDDLETLKVQARQVHIDDEVEKYLINLIFATREPQNYGLEEIGQYLKFGASPRGSIDLYKASKAGAFLRGRDFVTPLDIAMNFKNILRHRVILSYEGEAEGVSVDFILEKVLQNVEIP